MVTCAFQWLWTPIYLDYVVSEFQLDSSCWLCKCRWSSSDLYSIPISAIEFWRHMDIHSEECSLVVSSYQFQSYVDRHKPIAFDLTELCRITTANFLKTIYVAVYSILTSLFSNTERHWWLKSGYVSNWFAIYNLNTNSK